ncbi:MAG: thiol reductant ABC exporter subunit CydC, partial [Propionibacterium sp.]|nr:thiol reductant ABC exporter subunit CydC [Propionibacterium sp.]
MPDASSRRTATALVLGLVDTVPHGRRRLALSVLLAALASGASVALMGVAAWLLSRAAEHPPVLYLEAAAVGVRFFGIGRGVFRYAERLVGHDLALRMESALRLQAYDRLSRTTLLGRRRGDLLVRLVADVSAIQDVVVRVAIPFAAASLVMLGTSLILTIFSPAAAAVLLGTAVLAGWVLPWLSQVASRTADAATVPERGRLAAVADELAHAATDIVMAGVQPAQLARFDAIDARLRGAERRAALSRGVATAGQLVAAGIAVTASLLIGGQAVAAGRLLARDLAVLVLTPLALHEVFASFTQSAQVLTRARAALTRVREVLDAPPVGRGDQPLDGERSASGVLAVRDLTAGWPGAEPVVRNLSLRVGPGERLALVGPSGIGKTTVAATVMGLIPAVSGEITAPGGIAYLAQDAHIFATSVAENVRIG